LVTVSVASLLAVVFLPLLRPNPPPASKPLAALRGEPINPAAQTNPPAVTAPDIRAARKNRPKPASFQHRLVEFQVSLAEGTNADAAQGFGGNPAKVIFTPAQLDAMSDPPLPPGCEPLGFDTLSGFPFEVTREMADGANDPTSASAATRQKIPSAVQALDNHFVAIRGFLLPLRMNNGLATEFLLLRNQNMCCFGSVPKINEWICVEPKGEGIKPIMDQPITILGKLRVGEIRENGYLVGMYKMQPQQVYIHGVN
jgi:hypothetical protein